MRAQNPQGEKTQGPRSSRSSSSWECSSTRNLLPTTLLSQSLFGTLTQQWSDRTKMANIRAGQIYEEKKSPIQNTHGNGPIMSQKSFYGTSLCFCLQNWGRIIALVKGHIRGLLEKANSVGWNVELCPETFLGHFLTISMSSWGKTFFFFGIWPALADIEMSTFFMEHCTLF